MVNPMKLGNAMKMYKLWTHECIRVFSDRMIGNDIEVFLNVLHKVVDKRIHVNLDEIFTKTSEFLYCNFIGDKGHQECPDM